MRLARVAEFARIQLLYRLNSGEFSYPEPLMSNPIPEGRLFSDPDPDAARAAFARQARALCDKRTTVAEAIAKYVRDGDYLAVGGFGVNRIPTAVVHEILRQKKQNLSFAGHT